MKTERQLILDYYYHTNTLAKTKFDILDTLPTFLFPKGACYFSVDDKEKAIQVLNQHLEDECCPSYEVQKADYLNGCDLFFENGGVLISHSKLSIPNLKDFIKALMTQCRLYDYCVEPSDY